MRHGRDGENVVVGLRRELCEEEVGLDKQSDYSKKNTLLQIW